MTIPLIVHVTHEAGLKIGGIGAVLEGLLTSSTYTNSVNRTILAGLFPAWDPAQLRRILSSQSQVQVRYASRYAILGLVPNNLGKQFFRLEETLDINIFYGVVPHGSKYHELLLVDPSNLNDDAANRFAYDLFVNYYLQTDRYSHDSEWTSFNRLASPLAQVISALVDSTDPDCDVRFAIAHDWMGLLPVLALKMQAPDSWTSVFYAHEVAPIRRLIEDHEGHETCFYNVMRKAQDQGMFLDNIYGSQDDWFKVPLLHQAARCDGVLAVSDQVRDELQFLGSRFSDSQIDLVYNGIPSSVTTLAQKNGSRDRLRTYCKNLHGFLPDFVFTHVTRMVPSKGMWRDAKVLNYLARRLQTDGGQTAVLFVLSTSTGIGRHPDAVMAWEAEYGWPVFHRSDNGDLIGEEESYFFDVVQPFNHNHDNVKIVFVNQFGWDASHCGHRMPHDMSFSDIRRGSDLEFGLSIYEPFGIAQLEALTHGAVCCVSSVCGCLGFVHQVEAPKQAFDLIVEVDYVSLPSDDWIDTPWDALQVSHTQRNALEDHQSEMAANQILNVLARNDAERDRNLIWGKAISQAMGWNRVSHEYFVPALKRLQQHH